MIGTTNAQLPKTTINAMVFAEMRLIASLEMGS
jgi:hypothetical protein